MSPTMTEGGISTWKMKEGDTFAAGDIILEIETDKATMDVEAQDDGVMAKILVSVKGVALRLMRKYRWAVSRSAYNDYHASCYY
jgi:pyruvate/2-oxoglutarate dehydrogenase complex dihydrolipoamide acyltransferase (E2) component